MNDKKLLLITYYWPPSGGAGVQRWLKLSDYLIQLGWEVHVVTVDDAQASYPIADHTLLKEVNTKAKVHRTKTFEILNFYKKINNKKQIPYAGFANEGKTGLMQHISRFIRGNFFIPDARVGWNKYAAKKACDIIEKENIKLIVTTSPPHSTQLVGLLLKQKYNIKWVADLRDPWTDIYYYHKMNHTSIAKKIDSDYERNVIEKADEILVVSDFIKQQFAKKTQQNVANKITVLPNGFDEKNFPLIADNKNRTKQFTVSYNGTIASNYATDAFVNALKQLIAKEGKVHFAIQFTGSIDASTKQKLQQAFDECIHFKSHVSHLESIEILKQSDLLFLSIPNVKDNEGVLTGKLFEYLASQKPILCVGPPQGDAAKIIDSCEGGVTVNNDDTQLAFTFIEKQFEQWKNTGSTTLQSNKYLQYARKSQAQQLQEILLKQ